MNTLGGLIEPIATKFAKRVRHMESIDHDPEGQRVKKLLVECCYEVIETIVPPDDGTTVHVTRDNPQIEKVLTPAEHITNAHTVGRPAEPVWTGICTICNRIHDLRKDYGHAAKPPISS